MSFSTFPCELRDLIYHSLLCSPDGVRLHFDTKRWRKKLEVAASSHSYTGSREDEDKHELESEGESEKFSDREVIDECEDIYSVTPVSTAIFYVSHQIGLEAKKVFYSFNSFTFDCTAHDALIFLERLRPSSRRQVRRIGFTTISTWNGSGDCTDYWGSLCAFIAGHMSIHSVTIQVPKMVGRTPDYNWYHWPALKLTNGLLMAGKIQELRIRYSATLKVGDSAEQAGHSQRQNPLEDFESISFLRCPRSDEELEREHLEYKELLRFIEEGRPHKFDSLEALWADQKIRRQRFDFVVAREDDPIGDVGTVLVLTRRTSTEEMITG